jgi:hypothetical protein
MDPVSGKNQSHLHKVNPAPAHGAKTSNAASQIASNALKNAKRDLKLNEQILSERQIANIDQVPLTREKVKAFNIPPAVVLRLNTPNGRMGYGSGFPIHSRLVVTARHCVDESAKGFFGLFKVHVRSEEGLWQEPGSTTAAKSRERIPIRCHLLNSLGEKISIDLVREEGGKKIPKSFEELAQDMDALKKNEIQALEAQVKANPKDKNLKKKLNFLSQNHQKENPEVFNHFLDIAILEFDTDLYPEGSAAREAIPSLLDVDTIEHVCNQPTPKVVLGLPARKLKRSNSDEDFNKIYQENPFYISQFHNLGSEKSRSKTESNHQGLKSYNGNSGGPVVSHINGKSYYTGLVSRGDDKTGRMISVNLQGDVLEKLIKPTLTEVDGKEPKLLSLKDLNLSEKKLKFQQSIIQALFEWTIRFFPKRVQDWAWQWQLQQAIEKEDANQLLSLLTGSGLSEAADWLSIPVCEGNPPQTLAQSLRELWAPKSFDALLSLISPQEKERLGLDKMIGAS